MPGFRPRSTTSLNTAEQMGEHRLRPVPLIVAVLKLLRVLRKVLPGNVDVRPADRKLEACPEAFHGVHVATVLRIFASAVIDRLMLVSGLLKPVVRLKLVGMHGATFFDIRLDDRLERLFADVWDDLGHHVAVPLHHAEYHGLVPPVAPPLTLDP